MRKRPKETTTLRGSVVRSVAVDSSPSAYHTLLPRKWEAYSVVEERKIACLRRSSCTTTKAPTEPESQNIMRSKWTTLNRDAQMKVEELLHSIELPVLATYSLEQRQVEAQLTLRSLTGI